MTEQGQSLQSVASEFEICNVTLHVGRYVKRANRLEEALDFNMAIVYIITYFLKNKKIFLQAFKANLSNLLRPATSRNQKA